MFTQKEIEYIITQPLARLATVDVNGQPDLVAVTVEYDGTYFYIGGMNVKQTRKYKNVRDGNGKVSLLIDDLETVRPWKPRGIRIYGRADLVERNGKVGPKSYMRIAPTVSWSWDVEGPSLVNGRFQPHKTDHTVQ